MTKLIPYLRHLVLLIPVGLLVCSSTTIATTHVPNATADHDNVPHTTPTGSTKDEFSIRNEERVVVSKIIAAGEAFLPKTDISAKAAVDKLSKSYDLSNVESDLVLNSEFSQLSHAALKMLPNRDLDIKAFYAKLADKYDDFQLATFFHQKEEESSKIAMKLQHIQIEGWKDKTIDQVFLLLKLNKPGLDWHNPLLITFVDFVFRNKKSANKNPYHALLAMLLKYHGDDRGVVELIAAELPAVINGAHPQLQSEVASMVLWELKAKWTDSKLTPSQAFTRLFPASESGNCLLSPSVRIWNDYVDMHPKRWQSALLDQMKLRKDKIPRVLDDVFAAFESENIFKDIAVQLRQELLTRWQHEAVTEKQALVYLRLDTLRGENRLKKSHRLETWIQYMCLVHGSSSAALLFSALRDLLSVDQLTRLLLLMERSDNVRSHLDGVERMLSHELNKQGRSAENVLLLAIRNTNSDDFKNAVFFWVRYLRNHSKEDPEKAMLKVLTSHDSAVYKVIMKYDKANFEKVKSLAIEAFKSSTN